MRHAVHVLTVLTILCSGCALPVEVRRLDDNSSTPQGVRYYLKRPSYSVALRLVPGPNDKVAIANGTYCPTKNSQLLVLVSQNLKGEPLLYEVSTRTGMSVVPHALADTTISLTMDADGSLTAVSAKETDRTLEVAQAIAGLATKAAAVAAAQPCISLGSAFDRYVDQHAALLRKEAQLSKELDHILVSRGTTTSSAARKNEVETAKLIREQLGVIRTALKEIRYDVPPQHYQLIIDGKDVNEDLVKPAWVSVALSARRATVQAPGQGSSK